MQNKLLRATKDETKMQEGCEYQFSESTNQKYDGKARTLSLDDRRNKSDEFERKRSSITVSATSYDDSCGCALEVDQNNNVIYKANVFEGEQSDQQSLDLNKL